MILFIDMQNQRDSQFFFQTLSEKNTVNMNDKVKNSKENLPTVFQNSICINQSQGTYSKKNKLTYI